MGKQEDQKRLKVRERAIKGTKKNGQEQIRAESPTKL